MTDINKRDIKVEVSTDGAYLLLAIEIPKHTCSICGVVYRETPDVAHAKQLYVSYQLLDMAFHGPTAYAGWGHVDNDLERSRDPSVRLKRALVCSGCYGPVRRANEDSESNKLAASISVAANIDWSKL